MAIEETLSRNEEPTEKSNFGLRGLCDLGMLQAAIESDKPAISNLIQLPADLAAKQKSSENPDYRFENDGKNADSRKVADKNKPY